MPIRRTESDAARCLRILACVMAGLVTFRHAAAQDRVTYVPAGLSGTITAAGEILNVTGIRLTLQQGTGDSIIIPADDVRSIETLYDPAHQRGREQFLAGQTAAATISLREALEREKREWVRREILALLCQCSLRDSDPARAVTLFRQIIDTDPSTRSWGIAPLAWSPATLPAALRSEALVSLTSARPADRLIAASLLLLDGAQGTEARRVMQDLARDTNPRIADYSRSQLWRMDLARREVTEVTLDNWREQIARMPAELRGGPQYLLSKGCESTGNLRAAAAEALWIPYVYSNNEPLSSRALLEAGEALEKTGLVAEARVAYQELLVRYGVFPEAALARTRLSATAPR